MQASQAATPPRTKDQRPAQARTRVRTGAWRSVLLALAMLGTSQAVFARETPAAPRTAGITGVHAAQLQPAYWVRRQKQADRLLLDGDAIAARNARLRQLDPSLHDIEQLPPVLEGARVKGWIESLSRRPSRTLYDADGKEGGARQIDRLLASLDLKDIPDAQVTRYGLVTRRAALRTFPTQLRVFSAPGDLDIDRFQESALFPGTPVLIAHASRDGKWWFVVSETYAAWIDRQSVAEGGKAEVFGHARRQPFVVVTGATARTVSTPQQPQVSDLSLDMGVRLPLLADWPADRLVNGQHPQAGWVVELPIRDAHGGLQLVPALLPRSAEVREGHLPLTRANLLKQAFKFLGERYGWGHDYNARDCSGFVAEIHRSLGVLMPRNTSDQAAAPTPDRLAFAPGDSRARRLAVLRSLQAGDLVYVPGHVMLVIGQDQGQPYVIHDAAGVTTRKADGSLQRVALNGVAVTALLPLQFDGAPVEERITSIQRIRP